MITYSDKTNDNNNDNTSDNDNIIIIDHKKNSGWIHRIMLKKSNSLIVLEDKIVFKKNSKLSKPLVKLEKGRLVLIKKCLPEWCKIKAEKFVGWIETKNIWGKIN